jgi:hypothetical protein
MIEQVLLSEPVLALATAIIKPLASKAWEWGKGAIEEAKFNMCLGGLENYLNSSYQTNLYFTSLVFRNEQKKLDDFYLPLTLVHQEKANQSKSLKINTFPFDFFKRHQRVLIVDSAGMGKSTISKFLYLTCIREQIGVPIFIELRKLKTNQSIFDYIVETCVDLDGKKHTDLMIKLIKSGSFVFFFDGYDEIADEDRSTITSNINEFISLASKNWFLMTSREEGSLPCFSSFKRVNIAPLKTNEAYKLLNLYAEGTDTSKSLIEKLKLPENQSVHEFLSNPLHTSLLYIAFQFKKTVPLKKHIFYRQVFDALYEDHDLTKEEFVRNKRSGFSIDKFDEFMRFFCYLTYRNDKFEFSKVEILKFLQETKNLTANSIVNESDVLYDLTHSVPLMIEEGMNYRWTHRSMQEYFAAMWICRDSKDKQEQILEKIFTQDMFKHQNLCLLCADIDSLTFNKVIVKRVAVDLVNEYDSTYSNGFEWLNQTAIEKRKSLVVGKVSFIAQTKFYSQPNKPLELDSSKLLNEIENITGHQVLGGTTWCPFSEFTVGIIATDSYKLFMPHSLLKLFPFMDSVDPQVHNTKSMPSFKLTRKFNFIDDNSTNEINSNHNFQLTTEAIELISEFAFNIKNARKFLEDIENQVNASSKLFIL